MITLVNTFAILLHLSNMTGTCGGTCNGPVGSFTSLNYPADYCTNQDCYYNITVEEGYTIMVNFTTLHLETDLDDARDYVKVYSLLNALTHRVCFISNIIVLIINKIDRRPFSKYVLTFSALFR